MIRIREITENEQNLFDDLQGLIGQIGRASCRDRVYVLV